MLFNFNIDYWVDTMAYFEQASVRHLNEILVFIYTDAPDDGSDSGVYTFGSTKSLNDLIAGSSEVATARSPQFEVRLQFCLNCCISYRF